MKQTKSVLTGLVAGGLLALSFSAANADTFKLTASSSHPPFIPWVGVIKDHVVPQSVVRAKGLGHTIEWTEAYAGALYNFENTLEGIEQGLGDVGWVGTLWEPNKLPLINVTFNAPFVTDDLELTAAIEDQLHRQIPAMNEAWTKHNQVYLGPQTIDDYVLLTKFPVNKYEDLNGKKIYGPGDTLKWLEGTGATGIDGALTIYYNGLKTGVADGVILPGSSVLPFKLHEVAPYVTLPGFGGGITGALTMNKKTYDGLPKELQDMFKTLGGEYGKLVVEQVGANKRKHFEELLPKAGAKISRMSDAERTRWAQALPDIAGDWAKANDAKGLPATEVLKTFLEAVRGAGLKPYRDWDKAAS